MPGCGSSSGGGQCCGYGDAGHLYALLLRNSYFLRLIDFGLSDIVPEKGSYNRIDCLEGSL